MNNKESVSKDTLKKVQHKFIPPTLEEIQGYITEKQLRVNAKDFFDYFEAGNWVDSKGNKVKSWKQKLLTWEKYSKPKANCGTKQEKIETSNPFLQVLLEERGQFL